MQQSTLLINGSSLDKQKLLDLIKQDQTPEAIKYVTAATRANLKDSREIVDNLSQDPNYYDDYDDDIAKASGITQKRDLGHGKSLESKRKGRHVIASSQGSSKLLMLAVIVFIMALILYFIYY